MSGAPSGNAISDDAGVPAGPDPRRPSPAALHGRDENRKFMRRAESVIAASAALIRPADRSPTEHAGSDFRQGSPIALKKFSGGRSPVR